MPDTDRDSSVRQVAKDAEEREAEVRAAIELDRILDEALQETFPASDPVSISYRQPTRDTEN